MDYSKHYGLLIERARNRVLTGYVEVHHVLPTCMGGTDDRSNLVRLTAEEHFVAHQLLHKMHPHVKGLVYALVAMVGNPYGARSNKLYGWIRRQAALQAGADSKARWADPAYRARHKISMAKVFADPEFGKKISKANTGRIKSEQERANIAAAGRKRKPFEISDQARLNIAEAQRKKWAALREEGRHLQIGQKIKEARLKNGTYAFSAEHRANISKAGKGRVITADQRAKLSAALKGKKKSPEHVAKVAAANRKPLPPPPTPEEVAARKAQRSANCSAWQKGRDLPADHKAKIAEGLARAYANGRKPAMAKLTDDEVREIRFLLQESGIPQRDIAQAYGISQGSMSELKSGKSYQHVQ